MLQNKFFSNDMSFETNGYLQLQYREIKRNFAMREFTKFIRSTQPRNARCSNHCGLLSKKTTGFSKFFTEWQTPVELYKDAC